MGARITKRLVAIAVALALVLTSGICVFAATGSITYGLKTRGTPDGKTVKSTLKVYTEASKVTYCVNGNGSYKKVKNGKITGLKDGNTVIVKTDQGVKNYRWMKTVKLSQKKKGAKVTWNSLKKATGYRIQITTKNGKVTYKTVGKKVTSYKAPAGSTVRVRPLRKVKSGNVYTGIFSAKITVK